MADLYVNYNHEVLKGTLEALDASDLRNVVHPGMKVSIKPNLVLEKPPTSGATTHREVVEGIIRYLRDAGVQAIEVIESSWIGGDTKRAYRACGYGELERYGVSLVDLKDDRVCKVDAGEYTFEVFRKAVETDFLINVPVLKAHCQTRLTCNLKNLKGCITDREKRRFHTMGLHRPIAYLNRAISTHFCVVDGICGDLTFEEGGNPVTRNMILAGKDPLLVDSYCAELLGYRVNDIEYLRIASDIAVGRAYDERAEVVELNREAKPPFVKPDEGLVKRLAGCVKEDGACSACYSALISALHQTGGLRQGGKGERICIGQGFRGRSGSVGCGNCTKGFDQYVKGCPPKAVDVVEFVRGRGL